MNQAEMVEEYAQVKNDEFINIFCTPVQDRWGTSSRHVDSSNMHTFYQHHLSEHRWTKDHPLEQVIGNPSQSVKTRRQLESDGEMCMFALTVSQTEPKNIKEAMADSAWIESMQEELHQFDRSEVWELVDRPLCKNVINMKWLWKNKRDEENTVIQNKSRLVAKGYATWKELISKNHSHPLLGWKLLDDDLSGTPVDQMKFHSMVGALMYLTASRPDIVHATCYCACYQPKPTKKHLTAVKRIFCQTKYRSMVGALMYLTASRPDLMHATCYCARYQAKPTEKHLTVVKQIFRYLKDTIHMGLWYPKDTGFELTAFSDSDLAGCLDSCKSTSGGIQLLGGDKLVSWSSKSRTALQCPLQKPTIAISCNPFQHSRTKHIDVRYHFIKKKVEKGIVELFFVETEYQLADMFTKALPVERFKYLVRRLGMKCLTPEELVALANKSA
nr:retrovirus-related Pol polyprotein from transposon TNT 1-94 [Tanacetum cinerariifolium]